MSVGVSDTSPLNYLVLINGIDLLPRLFTEVFIPTAVADELSRPETPQSVRAWIAAPPPWLRIQTPRTTTHTFDLHEGEAHAILLAQELGVLSFLIDERKGFQVAESVGLEPIGLIGILELCASRRWIDFDEYIGRLRATSFRFHEGLIAEVKKRLEAATP